MAWNSTLDKDDVLIREHLKNLKMTHFLLNVTHVSTHTHAFHYFGGEGRVTERARSAQTVVLTVGLLHYTTESVTLHNALETFTFRSTHNGYFVAFLENFRYGNNFAKALFKVHVAELKYFVLGCRSGFFKVPFQRRRGVFFFALAVSELQSVVAIGFVVENLCDYTRASFDDRTGNVFTVAVVDAGHSDFFTNQTVH